jgi:tRNA(Ile)-lysidine synthase
MVEPIQLPICRALFRPGMRVAVAVSGGADSVALLRALVAHAGEMGVVLSVAHVNHGLRGAESDADEAFVRELAETHQLQIHVHQVDTRLAAATNREGIEEAARNVRYAFFRALLPEKVDAVATAHTLDDQAETVLIKMLRGAWTEGLGGIHPTVEAPGGSILRPLLAVRRSEIEAYLHALDQKWREDSSNAEKVYTRNRLRHQLLPSLVDYNPQIRSQLAAMSAIAREEESYWRSELAELLPLLLLPGKPVRGGGRSTRTQLGGDSLAIEVERLRPLHPALRRRVLRAALSRLGHSADFEETESLLQMCGLGAGKAGVRLDLPGGIRAERTPRELRLERVPDPEGTAVEGYTLPVPGEVRAERFGLIFRSTCVEAAGASPATIRSPQAGDRVQLRYTRGPKRIKEVFERMHVAAPDRRLWPLVEWQGTVVWMQGAEVESEIARACGLEISTEALGADHAP